jgi:hypothetical protein
MGFEVLQSLGVAERIWVVVEARAWPEKVETDQQFEGVFETSARLSSAFLDH